MRTPSGGWRYLSVCGHAGPSGSEAYVLAELAERHSSAKARGYMSIERHPRTWAAALTLYFLAPILGEIFSFNTPPLAFILDPGKFIFEPALYGSGALLIRETARRRGLGWLAILVMGAAY